MVSINFRRLVIIPMEGTIDISSNEWTSQNRQRKEDEEKVSMMVHWIFTESDNIMMLHRIFRR